MYRESIFFFFSFFLVPRAVFLAVRFLYCIIVSEGPLLEVSL